MQVSVLGNGRWGAFQAWYANRIGHTVTSYGLADSPQTLQFLKTRSNGMLTFADSITLSTNLAKSLEAEVIIISVPSQSLRGLCREIAAIGTAGKQFVLCMKGIETGTGKRLSEIAGEELPAGNRVAVWLGPGHVQEFTRGVPNCMVIDAPAEADKEFLVNAFSSDLIRFYYGNDMIGNEVGAAAKNVVGIAAGMLDGFGLTSLKGPLMSRGTREVARLIKALGGQELSAYGLCHLGDYEATVFSPHSHNRMFGELYARGETYDKLAEGYYTVDSMMTLSQQTGVELPICNAVYQTLYHKMNPRQALDALFTRSLKQEFYG
ncbi:MAG: glycerol-3-phosphate dehydrogenase [Ruminococcaceae bacterium]|nr:glycerol-3-phosphate dehydrogenase [Oscillospiraceae bacterium]